MHPAELKFVELAKRFATVGVQAAQAYNQEQAKLRLDLVLTQERLSSAEGTRESKHVLAQLRQLTEAHKQAYRKVVVAATAELMAAIAEMPTETQSERHTGLVSSINWQLGAQADFYATRERWMDAAEGICELIDSRRATCTFSEAGVDFAEDEDLAQFSELLTAIEEAHHAEVAALKDRLERLGRAASVLGIGPTT